jgi:hypothetical protein
MRPLRVIAAAVLDPRGLLLVSKRAAPGGTTSRAARPSRPRSRSTALRRELAEGFALGELPDVVTLARRLRGW